MANLKSSKKDIRRSREQATANKSVRTALKTYVKKVREAAHAEDPEAVAKAASQVQRSFDKATQRGIVHKNQAARRKSRIMSQAAKAVAQAKSAEPAPKAKVEKAAKTEKAVKADKPTVAKKPAAKAAPKAKKAKSDE